MSQNSYGSGTLFQRGENWYVSYWVNGKQRQQSLHTTDKKAAQKERDRIIGQRASGEMDSLLAQRITCGQLLDDLLEHARTSIKPSTEKIWRFVIQANIRPFFGARKVSGLTTYFLRQYRGKRLREGRSESTCNRELSILRTALNLGRKCTPPKVTTIPFFPIVREDCARQGFLTDDQYIQLRDALPDYLKPLFIASYFTGVRLGELLAWTWDQVDWGQHFVTLNANATKSGHSRAIPILDGDMTQWLTFAQNTANGCDRVFRSCFV